MLDIETQLLNLLYNYSAYFKNNAVDLDTPINTLDIDSLDLVEILYDIEVTFNINLSYEEFFKLKTFGDLLNFVSAKKAQDLLKKRCAICCVATAEFLKKSSN